MKFFNFFLFLWVSFSLLDPDPDCESGSGYGSRDTIESGPQHCLEADPRILNKCGFVWGPDLGLLLHRTADWYCLLFSIFLTLFTVQYIPDIVYCSVYSWHCLLFSIFLTLFTVQYIPDIVYCSVYSWHCLLFSISWHCLLFSIFLTLFTVQYIPDIVYCSVYSWHCLLFSIFLTLAVTLTVFPSITVLVVSEYRLQLIYPYLFT